jgi:hypothetical protein
MALDASDWQVISFYRTVANGFKLELGESPEDHPEEEGVKGWKNTRSFEWESPQFSPIFQAAGLDYFPNADELDAPVPPGALKALAQDAFAQMEREANPPAPAVADGTSLAELIS